MFQEQNSITEIEDGRFPYTDKSGHALQPTPLLIFYVLNINCGLENKSKINEG